MQTRDPWRIAAALSRALAFAFLITAAGCGPDFVYYRPEAIPAAQRQAAVAQAERLTTQAGMDTIDISQSDVVHHARLAAILRHMGFITNDAHAMFTQAALRASTGPCQRDRSHADGYCRAFRVGGPIRLENLLGVMQSRWSLNNFRGGYWAYDFRIRIPAASALGSALAKSGLVQCLYFGHEGQSVGKTLWRGRKTAMIVAVIDDPPPPHDWSFDSDPYSDCPEFVWGEH